MTLLTRLDKRLAAVFERASAWLVEDAARLHAERVDGSCARTGSTKPPSYSCSLLCRRRCYLGNDRNAIT